MTNDTTARKRALKIKLTDGEWHQLEQVARRTHGIERPDLVRLIAQAAVENRLTVHRKPR